MMTEKTDTADKSTETTAKEKGKSNAFSAEGVAALLKEGFNAEGKSEEEVQSDEVKVKADDTKSHEGETDEEREAREQAEAKAQTDADELKGRAEEAGRTVEEQEVVEQEEQALEERATEAGRTPEEQKAFEAEQAETEESRKGLSPELQKVLDKRIGKEVGKRKALEAQLEQVKGELEQAKSKGGQQSAPSPEVVDEKTLDAMETNGERLMSDIEAFLDESADEKERGRVEKFMEDRGLDVKGLKSFSREVQRTLTKVIPKERERLKEFRTLETRFNAQASELFPFLDKKDDPNYAKAQQVLETIPEIKGRMPHWKIAQGVYVLGLQAMDRLIAERKAKAEGKGEKKADPKPPKKLPTNQPPPKKEVSKEADDAERSERIAKNPSRENVMDALKLGFKNM